MTVWSGLGPGFCSIACVIIVLIRFYPKLQLHCFIRFTKVAISYEIPLGRICQIPEFIGQPQRMIDLELVTIPCCSHHGTEITGFQSCLLFLIRWFKYSCDYFMHSWYIRVVISHIAPNRQCSHQRWERIIHFFTVFQHLFWLPSEVVLIIEHDSAILRELYRTLDLQDSCLVLFSI